MNCLINNNRRVTQLSVAYFLVPFLLFQSGTSWAIDEPMIKINGGSFIMGSNLIDTKERWKEFGSREPWYLNEHPEHTIMLKAFYIDKFEVSYRTYRQFIQNTDHTPPSNWLKNGYALQLKSDKILSMNAKNLRHIITNIMRLDIDTRTLIQSQLVTAIKKRWTYQDTLPVTHVSWFDADRYCQFRHKRLPSEPEWEKAARGADGRKFVFGDTWQAGWSNVGEEYWEDGVAPMGSYPKDISEFGVMDMAGNVYEWVNDWYDAYPGSDYEHKDFGDKFKTVRGSGFGKDGHYFLTHYQRGAYRTRLHPETMQAGQGFRCAKSIDPSAATGK